MKKAACFKPPVFPLGGENPESEYKHKAGASVHVPTFRTFRVCLCNLNPRARVSPAHPKLNISEILRPTSLLRPGRGIQFFGFVAKVRFRSSFRKFILRPFPEFFWGDRSGGALSRRVLLENDLGVRFPGSSQDSVLEDRSQSSSLRIVLEDRSRTSFSRLVLGVRSRRSFPKFVYEDRSLEFVLGVRSQSSFSRIVPGLRSQGSFSEFVLEDRSQRSFSEFVPKSFSIFKRGILEQTAGFSPFKALLKASGVSVKKMSGLVRVIPDNSCQDVAAPTSGPSTPSVVEATARDYSDCLTFAA